MEALIHPIHNLSISTAWHDKILALTVNTEYDQKEQTFRNYLEAIGPLSSPVLAYEFDATIILPLNATVFWIDPLDRLADVNYLQVEESTLVSYFYFYFYFFISLRARSLFIMLYKNCRWGIDDFEKFRIDSKRYL